MTNIPDGGANGTDTIHMQQCNKLSTTIKFISDPTENHPVPLIYNEQHCFLYLGHHQLVFGPTEIQPCGEVTQTKRTLQFDNPHQLKKICDKNELLPPTFGSNDLISPPITSRKRKSVR